MLITSQLLTTHLPSRRKRKPPGWQYVRFVQNNIRTNSQKVSFPGSLAPRDRIIGDDQRRAQRTQRNLQVIPHNWPGQVGGKCKNGAPKRLHSQDPPFLLNNPNGLFVLEIGAIREIREH
jgi:hypothetical protein